MGKHSTLAMAETIQYDNPGGGTTPGNGNNANTYTFKEGNQNQKIPGVIFPITITDNSGATVTPTSQASLDVYNSSDSCG